MVQSIKHAVLHTRMLCVWQCIFDLRLASKYIFGRRARAAIFLPMKYSYAARFDLASTLYAFEADTETRLVGCSAVVGTKKSGFVVAFELD